ESALIALVVNLPGIDGVLVASIHLLVLSVIARSPSGSPAPLRDWLSDVSLLHAAAMIPAAPILALSPDTSGIGWIAAGITGLIALPRRVGRWLAWPAVLAAAGGAGIIASAHSHHGPGGMVAKALGAWLIVVLARRLASLEPWRLLR